MERKDRTMRPIDGGRLIDDILRHSIGTGTVCNRINEGVYNLGTCENYVSRRDRGAIKNLCIRFNRACSDVMYCGKFKSMEGDTNA